MSRTGKRPVALPDKVKVRTNDGVLFVEGPLGKSQVALSEWVQVKADDKSIVVTRKDDSRKAKETHGLIRALVQSAVQGVSTGFKKGLEIEGIGYRAEVKGNDLNLTLGYSHPVVFPIPAGIKIAVEKLTKLSVSGSDKTLVGQVAANIRALRRPEPYKGKGIRYEGEVIQRKEGKAAAASGGK